jgi:sirohydrochlorin cobaltochelatase
MKTKTLLLVAHGSREKSANLEFKKLVGKYRRRHPTWKIGYAFLELAEPSIPVALESLVKPGKPRSLVVLPLFLFAARHVKKHIPEILDTFQKIHPGVKIQLTPPLGSEQKILDILDQRAGHKTLR